MTLLSHGERSAIERSSPMIPGSEGSAPDVTREERMPIGVPKRKYSMTN